MIFPLSVARLIPSSTARRIDLARTTAKDVGKETYPADAVMVIKLNLSN
jgi:hypothetical protein